MKIAQYLVATALVFTSAAFAQPVINQILKSGGSTSGGESVYLLGTFPAGAPTVVIGGSTATVQLSTPTSILCLTPAGVGADLPVQVIIAGQSSNTVLYSYDMPRIESVNPFFGPTSGLFQIVITGTNFGTNPLVTIGGVQIFGSMTSPTTFTGMVRAGQGFNLPIVVDAGGQTNLTTPRSFVYNGPNLTSIFAPSNPTQGGGIITLQGSNFGQTPGVFVGTQFVSPIFQTISPTALQFQMPAGAGTGIPVRLSVAGMESNSLNVSYSLPTISSVLPGIAPTAGGTEIELTGTNLGPASAATILFDNQPVATSPNSSGHTSLKFLVPAGEGANHSIRVNVAGQLSNQLTLHYQVPVLSFIEPVSVSAAGGDLLHLSGNNFGLNPVVRVNGLIAPVISRTHTGITCRSPAQVQGLQQVWVTVGSAISQSRELLYTCPADFNDDGTVDFFDYLDFVDAYSVPC